MGEKLDKRTKTDTREPGQKVPQYQSTPDEDDEVELAGEDSFPASDPPSYTPVRHPGRPEHEDEKEQKGG